MNELNFKIYTKSKTFRYNSLNFIFLILWFSFIITLHFLSNDKLLFLEPFLIPYFIILGYSTLILNITSHYRLEPLKGKINGTLKISKDFIEVNSEKYKLEEIQHLIFNIHDMVGNNKKLSGISFDGRLSNGVDNKLTIILKSKEKIEVNFLQTESNTLFKREILIHYHNLGLITFMQLYDTLRLGYEEIQELKKELKTFES